jgi:cell division septation protein DedD
METALKQRLVGAAVLVALAVIFLPMLVQGPAPESGVSDVPLALPPTPTGQYETRDLPLVQPVPASSSGVVGMDTTAPAAPSAGMAPDGDVATPSAAPAASLPAPTAGGDYVLETAAHPTTAAADAAVAALRAARLPAFREAATVGGLAMQRVRIGPYATRAEAEAVRLQAMEVPAATGARIVVLDAEPVETKPGVTAPATKPSATKPVAAAPTSATAKPAAAAPAPKAPAASGTGFAVQLGAFSKAADATALRDRLRGAGFSAFTEAVSTDKGRLTRVRVGPVLDRAEADQLRAQVQSKLGIDGIVRPHPQ